MLWVCFWLRKVTLCHCGQLCSFHSWIMSVRDINLLILYLLCFCLCGSKKGVRACAVLCSLKSRSLAGLLFLHPVMWRKKSLVVFMLSQGEAWPTNKGHPVDEKKNKKQTKDKKKSQAQSIVNTVRISPQNNNNNTSSVCIPHTLLLRFLICLISVVVVSHFKQHSVIIWFSIALRVVVILFSQNLLFTESCFCKYMPWCKAARRKWNT